MFSFTPTDEQQMLIDAIHRYAANDIREVAHEADEATEVPEGLIRKGWELGILPGLIPEKYGGYADEQPVVTGVLALEELAWGDLTVALKLWTPALFALPVLISGTEEQKQKYLPSFCDMDIPAATGALIEPSVTFDPWRPHTTATPDSGGYILEGVKSYVPLAADAERMIVYATNSDTGQVDGYVVEVGFEGLEIGEQDKLLGIHALPTYKVMLSGVRVDAEARLGGEEGTDFATILSRSRIALGALATGIMRASSEYAQEYAKERVQFGVPIATKQAIAFRLADVAIEVDALRLLTWEAAWHADRGDPLTATATIVKQYTGNMALFVTDSGVQVLGGYGYIREYPVERWLRNARGFTTFDGLAMV